MQYWSVLDVIKQVTSELGLGAITTVVSTEDPGIVQFKAFLNAAGNELLVYYPWMQFTKQLTLTTIEGKEAYDLPPDWKYFVDQTQWDSTNHWPMLGPKSPQEWAWLKGGVGAGAPRIRYRVYADKMYLHPVPGPTPYTLTMEYIRDTWLLSDNTPANLIIKDGDVVLYDPWLINRYLKLKWYELKGLDSTGVQSDFMRIFNSLIGKDKGAPVLSISPNENPIYLGPWSIADGSWNVGR